MKNFFLSKESQRKPEPFKAQLKVYIFYACSFSKLIALFCLNREKTKKQMNILENN
jgi:hypothetical protein